MKYQEANVFHIAKRIHRIVHFFASPPPAPNSFPVPFCVPIFCTGPLDWLPETLNRGVSRRSNAHELSQGNIISQEK